MTPTHPKATPSVSAPSDAQRYYDVLKRIARGYRSAESILRRPEAGLDARENLEYAYDNIQHEANVAIRGKRRPKE